MTSLSTLFSTFLLPTSVASVLLAAAPAVAIDDAQDAAANRVASDVAKVEETYLVGPKAAADLGCIVAWQANIPVPTNHGLLMVASSPDGLLALNTRNEVSLIRANTGDRAWTASAAQAIDRVFGMKILGSDLSVARGRIAVSTDTVMYLLDLENGASLKRSTMRHMPSTRPVFVDGMVIFGSRNGQCVWVNAKTGFLFKSATIDSPRVEPSTIPARPATDGNVVVIGSARGTIAAFDAASGSALWRRELLGGVVASPVIADGVVFVASEDQYFYAFDLGTGETLWKYFTQTPLTSTPFLAGSLVVENIPGEGFVAFSQKPEGQLGGEVRWKNNSALGAPLTMTTAVGRDAIAFWCPTSRQVTYIDLAKGDVLGTVQLPPVEHLEANSIEAGGFVAWSSDGRIERLSPMPKAATAAAAPAAETNPEASAEPAASTDANG